MFKIGDYVQHRIEKHLVGTVLQTDEYNLLVERIEKVEKPFLIAEHDFWQRLRPIRSIDDAWE